MKSACFDTCKGLDLLELTSEVIYYFDPAANVGLGGLLPNPILPYWDLQVLGITGSMDPRNCVLTDTTGYDPSNINSDPAFVSEYLNLLQTVSVAQEGGNFVSVLFTPLTLTGDYHIQQTSPAINNGSDSFLNTFTILKKDYDSQKRPQGSHSDIGADEAK